MATKGRKSTIVLLLCAALALVGVFLLRDNEPSYGGKRLSEWLKIYAGEDPLGKYKAVTREQLGEQPTQEQREAAEAVRQIGDKAIPTLLSWIEYHPPAWKRKLAGVIRRNEQKRIFQWGMLQSALHSLESLDEIEIRNAGIRGLAILGEQAAPAVPRLLQLANDPDMSIRTRALGTLTRLGRIGLAELQNMAANSNSPNALLAVRFLASMKYLGTDARPIIPVLVQVASDPDPAVARDGIYTLCVLGLDADAVFPVFRKAINATNTELQVHTIHHLCYFGPPPVLKPLVPSISNCLHSQEFLVRQKAVEALTHIAPEVTLRSPDPEIRLSAIEEIALKGTASPSEVAPLLHACLSDSVDAIRQSATNAVQQVSRDAERQRAGAH